MKRWAGVFAAVGALWFAMALGGASGSIQAAPSNDNFANATPLSGQHDSRTGDTNVDATLETGAGEDPTVAGITGGASVWYSWTAPVSDHFTIDTAGSDFDTLLGVYTGTAVGALTEVASNDDGEIDPTSDVTSAVTFAAASGTTYHIRVDGFNGASGTINLHLTRAPLNDNFANAFVLTGNSASRLGDTNFGATLEPGEPDIIDLGPAENSVWYLWVSPADGVVTIDTATSDFDTLLAVYTGTAVNALTDVASNDDVDTGKTSAVTFPVTGGTTYRIRVDGYAEAVGTINLHLALAVVPDAPTNVAAAPGAGQATISWTAPSSDGGSAITGYDVTRYAGGVAQGTTSVGVATQAVVSGLTNGVAYTFRVAAKNAIGTGAQSTESNAVTPRTVPDAPTGVAAVAGAGQATVSWSAPAFNGGSAITGYDVTRYVAGVAQGTTSVVVATQATVTGLANGTAYTFKVAAKNMAGTGAQSAESSAVTPKTLPGAPTAAAATAGNGQATVSWSAPASDGGSAITGYDVTRYVAGAAQGTTSVGVVTQTTVTGLTNGTTYTFKVAAKNVVGAGAQSADSNAVTPKVPRFTLTVTKSGTGAGTVTSSVGGIACGAVCAGDIDAGTSVTLTATPDAGSTFAGWGGACAGTSQCTLTIDAAKAATATFAQVLLPVTRPVKCVVPNVKGKLLATAKRRITAAHCRVGRVTRAKSRTVARGKVISQSPRAGKRLARGTKVNLVVSRGRR